MGLGGLLLDALGIRADPVRAAAAAAARLRVEQWKTALRIGGVPPPVEQRLRDASAGIVPWVSSMTVAELALSRSHGVRPVAMVSGTAWWHYGYSWTLGHAQGWRLAIERLKAEAVLAGANAILDVQMRKTAIESGSSMDYTVIGTAVKVDGLPPSKDPILATVPAFEFVRLLEGGIVPVGIAVGAHYEWSPDPWTMTGRRMRWTTNAPLTATSDFWENIRLRAIGDLKADAARTGNGVLAHTDFGQLIECGDEKNPLLLGRRIVVATVVDVRGGAHPPPEVEMVIDLNDRVTPLTGEAVSRHSAYGDLNQEQGEI